MRGWPLVSLTVWLHSTLSTGQTRSGRGTHLYQTLINPTPFYRTSGFSNQEDRFHPLTKVISGWSSQEFYNSTLVAHSNNAQISLAEVFTVRGYREEVMLLSSPLLWLDTRGKDWGEDLEDEESVSNIGEAVMVANVVSVLTNLGIAQRDIGVISPYWAQVALIR